MGTEQKFIDTWLDIAPQYLNFCLQFPRNPARAIEPYRGKHAVARDLTTLLLAGTALAYLLAFTLGSPSPQPEVIRKDFGAVGFWFSSLAQHDPRVLPVAVGFIVIALALLVHGLARVAATAIALLELIGLKVWRTEVTGTVEDSVNGALGFSCVYVPYVAGLATAWLRFAPCLPSVHAKWVSVGLAFLLALPLFIYFPIAWAAAHPGMTARDGFASVASALALVAAFIALLGQVFAA